MKVKNNDFGKNNVVSITFFSLSINIYIVMYIISLLTLIKLTLKVIPKMAI